VLLTLRGTPCLYQGDELALADGDVPPAHVRDVAEPSRDPCRTPMPWTSKGGWTDPWLPLEDTSRNVEDQRSDPDSTLRFTRDLVATRTRLPELRSGSYAELSAPAGAWAWRRGKDVVVALNLGARAVEVDGVDGVVVLATDRSREEELVHGRISLAPAEGAIVARSPTPGTR
jgi:alpha-glucosidase